MAYEMRISDWSSDVCSSDLGDLQPSPGALPATGNAAGLDIAPFADEAQQLADEVPRDGGLEPAVRLETDPAGGLALVDNAQEAVNARMEQDYAVAAAPPQAGATDEAARADLAHAPPQHAA